MTTRKHVLVAVVVVLVVGFAVSAEPSETVDERDLFFTAMLAPIGIPTLAGKASFPYFRFYSSKMASLDRSWNLPEFEKPV